MCRTCAWCRRFLGEKPPYEDTSETHGICPDCVKKYFPEGGNDADSQTDEVSEGLRNVRSVPEK